MIATVIKQQLIDPARPCFACIMQLCIEGTH